MILDKLKFLLLTLAVVGGAGYAGSIAARQRARKLQTKQRDAEEILKWEGEGGNRSPASGNLPVLVIRSPTSSDGQQGILPWPGKVASTFECPITSR